MRHTAAHSARLGLSQVGPPSALLVESLHSLRTGPSHEGAFVEQLCQPVRIKGHMKTSGEGCIVCGGDFFLARKLIDEFPSPGTGETGVSEGLWDRLGRRMEKLHR